MGTKMELITKAAELFEGRKPLFLTAILGLVLGGVCAGAMLLQGVTVQPEGNLYKAAAFNVALGMFLITLALIAPLAFDSRKSERRWAVGLIAMSVFGYGVETIQVFRGLDPRFSSVGSPADQAIGGLFFVSAIIIMVHFLILMSRFFFRPTDGEDGALVLALRYGAIASILGFAVGIVMSVLGTPSFGGAGSLLPLHAAGFHGLQAVPLVALLTRRTGTPNDVARRDVHAAGLCWLGVCLAIAVQCFNGRSVLEVSPASITALLFLGAWVGVLAKGRRPFESSVHVSVGEAS